MRFLVLICLVGGCLRSGSVTCGDVTCPGGTTCTPVTDPDQTICATQAQLAACAGLHDHAKCHDDDIAMGRCYGGACLPIGCGNGRVDSVDPSDPTDTGEVCDDGNQISGDGCSADCLSNETCGNHIVDLAAHELCDDGNHVDHDGCDATCQPESPTWVQLEMTPAPVRQQSAMVWDSAHRQMVMFGGQNLVGSTTYGDTWLWDGEGWREVIPALSPPPRYGHAMAYDSIRHRVVLFGGLRPSEVTGYNDTWEWDGSTWTPAIVANSPPERSGHAMAFDAVHHRTILYGGRVPGTGVTVAANPDYPDTWAWDGASWSQLTPAHSPTPATADPNTTDGRYGAAMAFDPTRGVIVLFGGVSFYKVGNTVTTAGPCDTGVWEFDGTDWHETTPSGGPSARYQAAFTYDPTAHKLLLYGGDSPPVGTPLSDAWEWNGTTWTSIATTGPSGRSVHVMAGDVDRNVVVLFGGTTSNNDAEVWEWNGTAWTAPATGSPPPGMSGLGPMAVTDTGRSKTFLVDLQHRSFERADGGWKLVSSSTPPLPNVSAFVYDPAHAESMLFLATTTVPGPAVAQTWLWNGTTWSNAMPAMQPSPRAAHELAPDRAGHIVMFGGFELVNFTNLDDTWTWDGTTWTLRTPAHSPSARNSFGFAYDPIRGVTVLFGGEDQMGELNDTWEWDGNDWTEIPTARAERTRSNAAGLGAEPWPARGGRWRRHRVLRYVGVGRHDVGTGHPVRGSTGTLLARSCSPSAMAVGSCCCSASAWATWPCRTRGTSDTRANTRATRAIRRSTSTVTVSPVAPIPTAGTCARRSARRA